MNSVDTDKIFDENKSAHFHLAATHNKLLTPYSSPSWKAESLSRDEEPSFLSWKPKLHYGIHNKQPIKRFLSEIQPFRNITHCFLMMHVF
jgi:hypothetical protein